MVHPIVTVGHDATLAAAWGVMRARGVRHLLVLDADRRLAGIVTDHDLRQVVLDPSLWAEPGALAGVLRRRRVGEIMSWGVATVERGTELREAARIMRERNLGALPVTARGRAVGMLTATDVMGWLPRCPCGWWPPTWMPTRSTAPSGAATGRAA